VGQLDVTGWGFVAVLAAVTGLLWWRAAQPRRAGGIRGRHRRLNLVAAAILTVLLAGDGANSYFSYLPRVADVASVITGTDSWTALQRQDLRPVDYAEVLHEDPHGGVLRLAVPDRGSGFGRSSALAYLPPQYFTEPLRRFPVVYLLHGSPGMPADWLRAGGAEQTGARLAATGRPTLIVMPAMSHHWLDDSECVDSLRLKAETHLLRDVLPTVDSHLQDAASPRWPGGGGHVRRRLLRPEPGSAAPGPVRRDRRPVRPGPYRGCAGVAAARPAGALPLLAHGAVHGDVELDCRLSAVAGSAAPVAAGGGAHRGHAGRGRRVVVLQPRGARAHQRPVRADAEPAPGVGDVGAARGVVCGPARPGPAGRGRCCSPTRSLSTSRWS